MKSLIPQRRVAQPLGWSFSTLFFRLHTSYWRAPSRARTREIIEAVLPKARQRIVATGKVQIQLSGDGAPLAAEAARDALFQHLNHGRGRSLARFADEQIDVLRHDDVAHLGEALAIPHLTEDLDENISGVNRVQQGQASIARERNEMQMTVPVVANEFVGQGTKEKSKPRPFKTERVGHPEKRNQFLDVDALKSYHAIVIARQQKKREWVGHPPCFLIALFISLVLLELGMRSRFI